MNYYLKQDNFLWKLKQEEKQSSNKETKALVVSRKAQIESKESV